MSGAGAGDSVAVTGIPDSACTTYFVKREPIPPPRSIEVISADMQAALREEEAAHAAYEQARTTMESVQQRSATALKAFRRLEGEMSRAQRVAAGLVADPEDA